MAEATSPRVPTRRRPQHRRLGVAIASAGAKDLVLFMRRPGGQAQISAAMRAQEDTAPCMLALVSEIVAQPAADLRAPALADRVGMSERTFSRSFRKATGCTPAQFVEAVSVERAKAYPEAALWPLARMAQRAGFGSSDALRRAFMRQVGATPGSYREQVAVDTGAGAAATGRWVNARPGY